MQTLTTAPSQGVPKHRLAIRLGRVPAETRGDLLWFVDGRIEEALGVLGALPRPSYIQPKAEELLTDQLYRARLVGVEYLELHFESLQDVELHGTLVEADAATWRTWQALARKKPIAIRLEEPASDEAQGATDQEDALDERDSLGLGKSRFFDKATFFESDDADADAFSLAASLSGAAPVSDEASHAADERAFTPAAPGTRKDTGLGDDGLVAPEVGADANAPRTQVSRAPSSPIVAAKPSAPKAPPSSTTSASATPSTSSATRGAARLEDPALAPSLTSAVGGHPPHATNPLAPANFDTAAARHALTATSGALSFEQLEDLFRRHYLPLRHRALSGAVTGEDTAALARFDEEFAAGYSSAYPRLSGRARRPPMVLDAPRLAHALQRRLEAAHCRLLLVDAMRADIGMRVEAKLRLQLLDAASPVESGLLWAGLPTTTAAQLELLAKGADGLRTFEGTVDDAKLTSSAGARKPRALRAGPHTLHKLDAVQTALPQDVTRGALDSLAADVAVSAARFIKAQPPNCVVWLFGDHGFPTTPGSQSAVPEAVLVPFQAWLTRPPQGERHVIDAP